MDPDLNIPLKDRLGLTAWGVLCISGLYVCLYFTAYKQLRVRALASSPVVTADHHVVHSYGWRFERLSRTVKMTLLN